MTAPSPSSSRKPIPLYGGRDPLDLLALTEPGPMPEPLAQLRADWHDHLPSDDAWFAALADGVVPGTANAPLDVPLRQDAASRRATSRRPPSRSPSYSATTPICWTAATPTIPGCRNSRARRPRSPGRTRSWSPPPSPEQLHLATGDIVELAIGPATRDLPVYVLPGLAPDVVVATLGYGRTVAGEVGNGVGWNLYPFAAVSGPPTLRRTGRTHPVSITQREESGWAQHDDILRSMTLADFRADPTKQHVASPNDSLYRRRPQAAVAWGMSVDLNACIGCNACVVACMAENNVPVVGRDNVLKQREMHWLRIDRYWEGTPDTAQAAFQPMLCHHCEEAPCETVCPVEASVHDSEGLNLQVYNRCVGTRFCSQNCPYKVRRFNFGPYAQDEHRPSIARNPDVSVRARGVMEKCTFCVQRIAEARILHDRDGVPEQAVTACQAACPTKVFSFGDLNDPNSEVVRRKQSPLDYVLFPEQQTHPRLTYQARVRDVPGPA